MFEKIKNKRLFDRKNKGKHKLHKKLNDDFGDGQIIMSVDSRGGVMATTEDQLWKLCATHEELVKMGLANFRQDLIDEGTITQADIDAEKLKPDVKVKLQAHRQKIKS